MDNIKKAQQLIDCYNKEHPNRSYCCSGRQILGPTGPTGSQGITGPTGATGPAGVMQIQHLVPV